MQKYHIWRLFYIIKIVLYFQAEGVWWTVFSKLMSQELKKACCSLFFSWEYLRVTLPSTDISIVTCQYVHLCSPVQVHLSFWNKNYFKGNWKKLDSVFILMSKGETELKQNERNEPKSGELKNCPKTSS